MIHSSNQWELYIFGKRVDIETCTALEGFSTLAINGNIHDLVVAVDNLHICSGHPDSSFVTMVQRCPKMKSVVLDGHGDNLTVRHSKCELIARAFTCPTCKAYRPTLRSTYSRYKKLSFSPTTIDHLLVVMSTFATSVHLKSKSVSPA